MHTPTLCEEHLRADTSPAELPRSTRCCASNTCTNTSAFMFASCAAVAVCTNTSTFACHRAPPPRSRNALPTSRDYVGGALAPLHSERPSPDERRTPNAAPSESLRLGNAAMQLAVWKRGDGVRCSSGTVFCIAVCTPGRKGPQKWRIAGQRAAVVAAGRLKKRKKRARRKWPDGGPHQNAGGE